jgi:Fe-S-cluster containining protein
MSQPISDAFTREVERRAAAQRLDVFLSSRDAGEAIARTALEGGISLPCLIGMASDTADYADEAIAIVREEYRPRLDCAAGCSYCCRKPGVLVSIPELLRIVEHVRATFDSAALAELRERARAYVERLGGRSFDAPTTESFPCPLLRDDRCSAYDLRPLTCRGYNSTSVDACRQAHESTEALVPIFVAIKDVTDGATVGAAHRLREIGFNDALVDLGTALHLALDGDERFAEAVAEGASALRPAENASWVGEMWSRVRETARDLGIEIEEPKGPQDH